MLRSRFTSAERAFPMGTCLGRGARSANFYVQIDRSVSFRQCVRARRRQLANALAFGIRVVLERDAFCVIGAHLATPDKVAVDVPTENLISVVATSLAIDDEVSAISARYRSAAAVLLRGPR